MAIVNECIPYYEPGGRLTCHVEADVTGKRFVAVTDPKQAASAGLTTSVTGGNIVVSPCGAGARGLGVAVYDKAAGGKVPVIAAPGTIVPVLAGAAITGGNEVEVAAGGKVIPLNTGKAVGMAVGDASNNTDALIKLY